MKLRYTYLSDGTKVSALDAAGDGLLYRGNFVYGKDGQNVSLESIAWDEGRIRNKLFQALHYDEPVDVTDTLEVIDTLPGIPWHPKDPFFPGLLAEEGHWVEADTTELVLGPAINREPLYQDQWFVRDHLGNVRSVIDLTRSATMPADSVILEQDDYLPYGTKSSTSSLSAGSAFRYRYAGKEEQRFGAFDSQLLDFGARYYDPWSCQWTAVDPMGEDYLGTSPFGYCACDPMDLVDLNGMNWYSNNGNYIWRDSTDDTYTDDDGNVWSNVGTTVSLDLGNGKFQNWFENVGFEAGKKFNAEEYILSHNLVGEYLSSGSDLCEIGQLALYIDYINYGRQAFLDHPVTKIILSILEIAITGGIFETCWVSDNRFLEDIYRVYGGDSKMLGKYWSPNNPETIANYRSAAGLPTKGGASSL